MDGYSPVLRFYNFDMDAVTFAIKLVNISFHYGGDVLLPSGGAMAYYPPNLYPIDVSKNFF